MAGLVILGLTTLSCVYCLCISKSFSLQGRERLNTLQSNLLVFWTLFSEVFLLIMKTLTHLLLPSLLTIFKRLSGQKFIFSNRNYS